MENEELIAAVGSHQRFTVRRQNNLAALLPFWVRSAKSQKLVVSQHVHNPSLYHVLGTVKVRHQPHEAALP